MAKRNLIPIFIPQGGCRDHCIFCNQRGITGCAEIPSEHQLNAMIPVDTDETWELACYGGTFTALSEKIMLRYLKFALSLLQVKRIGSIRISTHPSYINDFIAERLRNYGVTTVELGVQSMDDSVLEKAGRSHGKVEILNSIRLLKRYGFSVGVQLMTGLPGDSREKILRGIQELLPLRPDMVRIYPLLVLEGTPLAEMWRNGEYQPQPLEEAVSLAADMYAIFRANDIPVIRMGLQTTEELNLQSDFLLAGPFHPSFGHLVRSHLKRKQMEMLLEGHEGDARFLSCRADLPLLFGEKGSTLAYFSKHRGCAVSGVAMARGAVALSPFPKRQRNIILKTLSEQDFLSLYLKRL